jgi:hypothetical protein
MGYYATTIAAPEHLLQNLSSDEPLGEEFLREEYKLWVCALAGSHRGGQVSALMKR